MIAALTVPDRLGLGSFRNEISQIRFQSNGEICHARIGRPRQPKDSLIVHCLARISGLNYEFDARISGREFGEGPVFVVRPSRLPMETGHDRAMRRSLQAA